MTDSWGSYRSWDLGSTQPSKVEARPFAFDLEIDSVRGRSQPALLDSPSPSNWSSVPLSLENSL